MGWSGLSEAGGWAWGQRRPFSFVVPIDTVSAQWPAHQERVGGWRVGGAFSCKAKLYNCLRGQELLRTMLPVIPLTPRYIPKQSAASGNRNARYSAPIPFTTTPHHGSPGSFCSAARWPHVPAGGAFGDGACGCGGAYRHTGLCRAGAGLCGAAASRGVCAALSRLAWRPVLGRTALVWAA